MGTAMKMQVQQFLKTLLDEVTDESVKGCVRDLGYWNQVTIDAIKDNTPMQTFVEKVAVPMVDCSQKTEEDEAVEVPAVEEPAVEEPAVEEPAVEEPTTTEPTTTEPETTEAAAADAGDFDLTDFDFGARRAQDILEPEAADDTTTPVDPTPAPAKETLDSILDAWVDWVETTLVNGKKCGDKWMEYGEKVADIYGEAYENNTGLYDALTAHMNAMNEAWRACL